MGTSYILQRTGKERAIRVRTMETGGSKKIRKKYFTLVPEGPMESGGSKKRRKEDTCWMTKEMREMGGERVIKAILEGKKLDDVPDFPIDPKAKVINIAAATTEVRRGDNPEPPADAATTTTEVRRSCESDVPPRLQIWRKEFYASYLKDRRKKATLALKKRLSRLTIGGEEELELEDKSDYEYPNIADFRNLGLMERINCKDYQSDLARYTRDEQISDGFDVGYYPYRDAVGICGSGFVFRHYKPPQVNLPKAYFNTLVHLSQLAISVYNMYQLHPTHYDNVQVLKAMKFGPYGTDFNITFQTSSPTFPTTFQTRVYNLCYPAFIMYTEFEVVLVRKVIKGPRDLSQETDYVGEPLRPGFPSSMEHLSDFNEQDPQSHNTLHIPSEDNKLPLYLCQFALHQFNIDRNRGDDYHDKDDELYDNVKVLRILKTLKTLDDEHGTTYYVIFAASLLDDSGNPQIFETKFFVSPLVPTTKIKIKFVRIKGN